MEIRVNRVLWVALLFSLLVDTEKIVCASYERIPPSQCRELSYRMRIKGQRRYKNKTIKECIRWGKTYEIVCCLYDLDIKKRILWTYDDGRIIQISHKCNGDKEIYLLPSAHINLDLMDAYTAQTISNELLNKLHLKLDGPETYLYVLRRGEVFIDWPIDDDFSSIAFDNPLLAALQKDILETDQLRVFVPRYLRVVPSWSY